MRNRRLEHLPGIVMEGERYVRSRHSEAAHGVFGMPELGAGGAQELAAGRNVEEEIAHLHRRAELRRGGLDGRDHPPVDPHPRPTRGVPWPTRELDSRHRGDARQRLPAKPHARDAIQIVERCDLAGRMARERESELAGGNTESVVAHPDQTGSSRFELDVNRRRIRIERVLDELLDHRRGALHDLPGRDLVRQHPGQGPDRLARRRFAHRSRSRPFRRSSPPRLISNSVTDSM